MQDSKAANAPEKYDWKFPFPLNECYFVGANHEGFQPSKGMLTVLHIPTGDIWNITTVGIGRALGVIRVIDGSNVPARFADQVQAVLIQARLNCGGVLSSNHPSSEIFQCDRTRQFSEVWWNRKLQAPILRHHSLVENHTQQTQKPCPDPANMDHDNQHANMQV